MVRNCTNRSHILISLTICIMSDKQFYDKLIHTLSLSGIVNLMDYNLTLPQHIVVMIILNALCCIVSYLVSLA
jgi:hypothetical protein